jgi:hypothetical protein
LALESEIARRAMGRQRWSDLEGRRARVRLLEARFANGLDRGNGRHYGREEKREPEENKGPEEDALDSGSIGAAGYKRKGSKAERGDECRLRCDEEGNPPRRYVTESEADPAEQECDGGKRRKPHSSPLEGIDAHIVATRDHLTRISRCSDTVNGKRERLRKGGGGPKAGLSGDLTGRK